MHKQMRGVSVSITLACLLAGAPFAGSVLAADKQVDRQANKQVDKHLEDSPEVAEKLRLAIEKIGKNKTGTLKINTAELEMARAKNSGAAKKSTASETNTTSTTNPARATRTLAQKPASVVNTESAHEAPHWAYAGKGAPEFWSTLAPENKTCASGQRQSPIHIQDSDVFSLEGMESIGFEYRPSPASIVHNGHTLQVDITGDNRLRVRATEYRLVQFHFHHPAEERINSQGFEMVAHLVHRAPDGQLAVVAILFEIGAPNGLLHTVWGNLPLEVGDRVRWNGPAIDVGKLLPTDRRYYQFIGSLTTPPCSEGVLWIVLKQPMTISAPQLAVFARLFPNNARPTQPLNGRIIKSAQ